MKKVVLFLFLSVSLPGFFVSCVDLEKELDSRIYELQKKVESLGATITKEANEVVPLESITNKKDATVKKVDSIVTETTTALDSIVTETTDAINPLPE